MNRNYGKLNEGNITYAPETLYIDGKLVLAPRAEHFAAAGWLKIYDDKPVEKAGVCFIPYGWEAREGAIYRTFLFATYSELRRRLLRSPLQSSRAEPP